MAWGKTRRYHVGCYYTVSTSGERRSGVAPKDLVREYSKSVIDVTIHFSRHACKAWSFQQHPKAASPLPPVLIKIQSSGMVVATTKPSSTTTFTYPLHPSQISSQPASRGTSPESCPLRSAEASAPQAPRESCSPLPSPPYRSPTQS